MPNYADAFWLFSTNADATVNVLPQHSETTALRAATNFDPNPNKGLGDEIQTSGGKALLAYARLSPTVAYGGADATAPGRISVYVVRPGDTLSEIADMFGVSVNTIIWANDLKNARDVRPGNTLIILPVSGVEHIIKRGDTLASLAKKYGADADEIAQFNGLDSTTALTVGSTVIVPDGEIAAPEPPKRPATAVRNPSLGGGTFFAGYFINPLPGGIITQGPHDWSAVDIGAARGTPIYAAAQGVVIIARGGGARNGGYGNYVVITHDNDSQTLYSHMSSVAVSSGQSVAKGQTIGYVGSTGRSTGPHLHFEVRGAQNPLSNCRVGSVCSPQ